MGTSDVFVVYRDGFPIVTGTAAECARALGVKEKTIIWYSSPGCAEKERKGKRSTMAVRIEGGTDG